MSAIEVTLAGESPEIPALTASVIIRNRNEGGYLTVVLEALAAQSQRPEVILVDNESDDDSVAIARASGCRIVTLPKTSFSYGRALNVGMQAATGDVCILLSAHCLPLGRYFIVEALKPFADVKVAAARCLHVEKFADLVRWTRPEILTYPLADAVIFQKGPLANGCAIRRAVWAEVPFDEEVVASEDKLWAREVLTRGYSIYSPCSALYFYMKRPHKNSTLERMYKEELARVAISGSSNYTRADIFVGLMRTVFWSAPLSAAAEIVRGSLKSYYIARVYLAKNKKPRHGNA